MRGLYWDPTTQLATELIGGFSFPHEIAVLQLCKEIIALYLKSFKTTLEEDRELLANSKGLRTHFAVRTTQISYRIGMKSSLQSQLFLYDELIRTITRVHAGTKLQEIEEELEATKNWSRGTVTLKFALEDYLQHLRTYLESRD